MAKSEIIIFSTADWSTPYWTNKQHMAECFASLGYRVLYVESFGLRKPKIKSGMDWKRVIARGVNGLRHARQIKPNLWVLSLLVMPFGHGNKWIKKINVYIAIKTIEKFIEKQKFFNPLVWTYHPYMLGINCGDALKNSKIIYHCVDDLSSIPGIDKEFFLSEEKKLLEVANVVFVTNKLLEYKCKKINEQTFLFPNVVDYDHFSSASEDDFPPQDLSSIPEPRVVYVGALSDFKIDFKMMDEVIQAMPEYSFVFIGGEIEGQNNPTLNKVAKYKNSYFIGYKSYKLLPRYLSNMQVGVLPVIKNSYTDSMAPMKLLEYIAAGLPVVASKIDYLSLFNLNEKIIKANTNKEFVSGIKIAAEIGKISYAERLNIVKDNTWDKRIRLMMEIINEKIN